MTPHDEHCYDIATRVASGDDVSDADLRALADFALRQHHEYHGERSLRLAAESLLNELVLRTSPVQPVMDTPLWLTTLRQEGLL